MIGYKRNLKARATHLEPKDPTNVVSSENSIWFSISTPPHDKQKEILNNISRKYHFIDILQTSSTIT